MGSVQGPQTTTRQEWMEANMILVKATVACERKHTDTVRDWLIEYKPAIVEIVRGRLASDSSEPRLVDER